MLIVSVELPEDNTIGLTGEPTPFPMTSLVLVASGVLGSFDLVLGLAGRGRVILFEHEALDGESNLFLGLLMGE